MSDEAKDLKEKIAGVQQKGGSLSISSSDLGGSAPPATVVDETKLSETTAAKVPLAALEEPLMKGGKADAGSGLAAAAEIDEPGVNPLDPRSLFSDEEVEITPDDKAAFIEALVHGKRFTQTHTLFGGSITVEFRSRSIKESEGIADWINLNLRDGKFNGPLAMSLTLRNCLLAAGIQRIDSEEFAELAAPFTVINDSEGKRNDPGWLKQADAWRDRSEVVVSGIYNALKVFERKYWTMVFHANDQNFWHPVELT